MYEICFGDRKNFISWIRSSNDHDVPHVPNKKAGSVFNESVPRVFEIDWRSPDDIRVYEYMQDEVFLLYSKVDIEINYLMLSTGFGSEGEWEVWLL